MFKFLIGLFTLITSFFGLWGSTNSVLANTSFDQLAKSPVINSLELPTSLNVIGSLEKIAGQDSKSIFDHLGCSCANCVQIQQTHTDQNL